MATTEKKLGSGISGWFSALMGKPKSKTGGGPVTNDTKPVLSKLDISEKPPVNLEITDFSKEDSVKEDIKKLKSIIGKYKTKVDEKVLPITSSGAQKAANIISASGGVADKPFYKKLLKVFFVIFFILILVFIAATLFNILKSKDVRTVSDGPTSTPVPYEPIKPSVYADDGVLLKLEEDVDLLENELVRVGLRENDLLPPKLDFNVNFK